MDVNIAARLVEAAGPGEILVSEGTFAKLEGQARDGEEAALPGKGNAEGPRGRLRAPLGTGE